MNPPDRPAGSNGVPIVRLVSWNIHGGVGRSGRANRERTMAEIARLAPDILVLQEVDGRVRFGRQAGAFTYFRNALADRFAKVLEPGGCHVVEARTSPHTGNLLWSRCPIQHHRILELPGPDIERRRAIDARVRAGSFILRVLGTHFGLLPTTRLKQARIIAEALTADPSGPALRTVLMGDLNEWSATGWVDRTLTKVLPQSYKPRSWPERHPLASLDRAYLSADLEIVAAFSDRSAGMTSDHRPIILDVRL